MPTVYTPIRKKNAGEVAKDAGLNANSTSSVGGSIYTGGAASVTLQVVGVTGTHATHVVKLQGSVDNTNWTDTATTLTGNGAAVLSSPAYPYHRAKVTTAEGATSTIDTYVFARV